MSEYDFDEVIDEDKWEAEPRSLTDLETFVMALKDAYPKAVWAKKLIQENVNQLN